MRGEGTMYTENVENMDYKIRHLQCISSILDFLRPIYMVRFLLTIVACDF